MNPMKAGWRFISSVLIIFLLLTTWRPVQAQSADVQFFPETGHNVKGDFLKFYKTAKDPKLVYGYPITEQITSKDGKTVQYFQRARFEIGKDLLGNPKIVLTALGQATYKPDAQLKLDNSAGCQLFITGQRVCYAFLDFFKANGGTEQFGNPISPFEFHNKVIVQYFERARFEWRADRPKSQRVVITDLGRIYFDQLSEDPAQLKPVPPQDASINSVLSIKVRAFVDKSVTLSSGKQTVNVIVQSQTLQPVKDANGKITVHWSDGTAVDYFFVTNSAGVGSASFSFSNQKQGELVPIDVVVVYQGLSGTTTTSFRIWF
ncbi:MAG: hypothetical protein QM730_30680 [Anaerolineales bacterium]